MVQIDQDLINDVRFNNENYKSVWVKMITKDNPGNYLTFLAYVSNKKQVCIHQTKSYENNRLKTIEGKENNPAADCLSVEPGKVAHYIYDYMIYHRHIADANVAAAPPQPTKPADSSTTPPSVNNPPQPPRQPQPSATDSGRSAATPKKGGGLFAK